MKSSFTASRVQPCSSARGQEAGAREEVVGLVDVGIDEHVLPRHQHVIHDEDRVVLVQPARQRVVERTAHRRGALLVGHAADQLHAGRVGRHDEDHGEVLVLHRDQSVVRDEGVVRQRRTGGDDLGAADADAGVGLLGHAHVDVGRPARRAGRHVAIHRRMDDRVVDERQPLLAVAVPVPRVVLIRRIEFGVGTERGEERRLVVGRPAQPAIAQPRPGGDRVTRRDLLVGRAWSHEIPMREAAPFGRACQHVAALGVVRVQRVVKPREHPCDVAERGMAGDVRDALAIDPDLAAIVETVEEFLAAVRNHRCRHLRALPVVVA